VASSDVRDGTELRTLLGADHDRDVAAITTVLEHAGDGARRYAQEHLARAADALGVLDISSEAREQWRSLTDFLATRTA
jgi:geranylgeranyl pyrophosphate synthase